MQALSFGVVLSGAMIDLDGTLFLQMAIFFALFAVLYGLLFKPLLALFEARESAIDGAKTKARDLEKQADEKFRTFETEMKKVKVEANAERDRIRQDALHLERELLTRSRAEADGIVRDATEKLTSEGARVRTEMQSSIPSLAADIAERLLGRKAS